jgi:hypothetical protein
MRLETVPAGIGRRGAALLLEALLFWLTLCLGWFVWLFFTSRRGTTPAKGIIGLVIVDAGTGRAASRVRVWYREVVVKNLLPGVVGIVAEPFLGPEAAAAIATLYLLSGLLYPSVSQGPRTTWDYLAGTEVRRQVTDTRPLYADDMRRLDEALPSRRSAIR